MVKIHEVEQICENVVMSIRDRLEQRPPVNREPSIYRVPKLLREMNNKAYIPQVISIGPFYHRSPDLITTEQYKVQGLSNFLIRLSNKMECLNNPGNPLEVLVRNTQSYVDEYRNCYGEPINMNDKDFIEMMIVDGGFIVEFLILHYGQYKQDVFPTISSNVDYSFYKRIPDIDLDLIKLENQIPFSVLEHMFELILEDDTPISVIELANVFLQHGLVHPYELSTPLPRTPKHFVDFLSLYFVVSTGSSVVNIDETDFTIPPSITKLCQAGVTIKKAEDVKFVMDISFENGIFKIPPLHIDDNFETMIRNLIAFEQISLAKESKCIQYITFMDYLISTEEDVNLLENAGIIINDIGGSAKEVSKLFNDLCKFVTVPDDTHFNYISAALLERCNRRWNSTKATLKRDYFYTPWASVAAFGAISVIILAILQTIFSGISTFQK
ncbi:putative UPF0481 protein At3g02645 [Cucurbita moschata]|uniref:UPF0481 protein At3g02645 n=1 Tax=Cucurbita moschata TaxID=3662 RepID=A0A6J1HBM9_CUCMO|nr:putative UPF0481 protein At3g02645 [Cucurbita moschata]